MHVGLKRLLSMAVDAGVSFAVRGNLILLERLLGSVAQTVRTENVP
jgi:hypothetical protein